MARDGVRLTQVAKLTKFPTETSLILNGNSEGTNRPEREMGTTKL